MSSVAKFLSKNIKEDCYAFVCPLFPDQELLNVFIVGYQSESGLDNITFRNAKEFIDAAPKLFTSKFKAVILQLYQHETSEFSGNLEFCKAVKSKLNSLQIPNYFISDTHFGSIQLLLHANISLKVGESIVSVIVLKTNLTIALLEFTENGYKIVEKRNIFIDRKKESAQAVRQQILGSLNPKKVLLLLTFATSADKKFYRDALKSKKLVVFDNDQLSDRTKFVVETCKWLLDKTYTKFHFLPICSLTYQVGFQLGDKFHCVLLVKTDEPLPFKESHHCPRILSKNICFGNGYNALWFDKTNWSSHSLEENCHRYNLTITVDEESFPKIQGEPVINREILDLPKTLDSKMDDKIPVIGFFDSLSFICVNNQGGYKFLDSWNGGFGKELIIGFDQEKPSFCEKALPLLAEKPSFVVFNIMEIMFWPSTKLNEYNEFWPFKITEDDENPVLLQFDSFDGTRKAASPAFLMAMLLKEHRKVIKVETGEKPKKIGFHLMFNYTDEQKKQVKTQLQESCDLLKIECVFVE